MATDHDDHPNQYDERIADAVRSMADDDGQLTSPPATLWGRIERAVDDPTPAPGPDLTSPPPELWDRIAQGARAEGGDAYGSSPGSRRRWQRVATMAAAIVVVVALAGAAVWFQRSHDGGSTQLVAEAALSGKGLDPGGSGSGSAELIRSGDAWKVAIAVADLPSPPKGTYYEAWLLSAGADQVQSLGTLDGTDRFTVPDGLAIDDFPLVDVSIEPIDGNPAHSAKSVLRGRLETT